jgi:hypothetical protein
LEEVDNGQKRKNVMELTNITSHLQFLFNYQKSVYTHFIT